MADERKPLASISGSIATIEHTLHWWQVYSHVLALNVSEKTRLAARAEADRECPDG